jgi:glycosyltransferase involved in cell wall biosynthesis
MTDFPTVSILLPIRNEEAFIERCLGAILAQDYPSGQIHVLIADGMSTDRTREIIASMPDQQRITVLDNPAMLQASGLNLAIQQATGEVLVRVDGHTIIAADYVRQCVKILQETGADNVGGPMDPVGETAIGRAIAAAGKSPFGVPTAFHVSSKAQYTDTVYLGAWPRQIFERVGLFSQTAVPNEDYEMNVRIRKTGGKIYLSPAIRSQYFGRQTFDALAHQYRRYGGGKLRTLREHPGSLKLRHLVAPVFFAYLVIGGVASLIGLLAGSLNLLALWTLGLVVYGLLAAIFAQLAARRAEEADLWPAVALTFFIMHVSWGLGFWRELIRPQW